jgi:hypothetical protein
VAEGRLRVRYYLAHPNVSQTEVLDYVRPGPPGRVSSEQIFHFLLRYIFV